MSYRAPVKDMLFDMQYLANIDQVAKLPGFEDAGLDTAQAVLEECAKFNEGVMAPLNRVGDLNHPKFKDGHVSSSPGFKEAFAQFTAGGWQGLAPRPGCRPGWVCRWPRSAKNHWYRLY